MMSLLLKDRRIQLALALAVVEWVIAGVILAVLDTEGRGLVGVIVVIITWVQLGLILYRRQPRGPLAQAQTAFMQGDYASAEQTLHTLLADTPHHTQAQTLLGNTYRHMGDLDTSERTLRQALHQAPQDDFPWYGLGRTLLAKGDYLGAAEAIQQALAVGGRKIIQVDLALVQYLANQPEAAQQTARRAARLLQLEPHRVLMANYLLLKLADDTRAPSMMHRAQTGITYWQAEADRFPGSDYQQRLTAIIRDIQEHIRA